MVVVVDETIALAGKSEEESLSPTSHLRPCSPFDMLTKFFKAERSMDDSAATKILKLLEGLCYNFLDYDTDGSAMRKKVLLKGQVKESKQKGKMIYELLDRNHELQGANQKLKVVLMHVT